MSRRVMVGAAAMLILMAAVASCARAFDDGEPETVYWPLTGEIAPDEAAINARVVSVKIDNSAAARPQAGLSGADVVYETLSEGGIPRFNAFFHSVAPARVGPVRSARLSDIYVVPQYGALLSHSGVSAFVRERIAAAGIDDLGMERHSALYQRDPGRSAPHNVHANVAGLRDAAGNAGYATERAVRGLLFGPVPAADDDPEAARSPGARTVTVPFAAGNTAVWRWNESAGRWLRETGGRPHSDEGSDEAYSAANVVIMYVEIRDTGMLDAAGSPVLDVRLDGEGDAVLLRDGRRYDVRWTATEDTAPRFEGLDGQAFPLAVGPTWIEAVPPGYGVSIE